MRAFLIAALCTSLAYAKPQYNYPAPSGSYGVPSTPTGSYGTPAVGTIQTADNFLEYGKGSSNKVAFGSALLGAGADQARRLQMQGQATTSSPQGAAGGFSQTSQFGGGFAQGGSSFVSGGTQSFSANQGIAGKQVAGAPAIGLDGGLSGGISGGGTLVQKHIYVHVAPEEPEEFRPRRPISAGQATKHYKIIFIKAPSYQTYQQQILQQQAQNEEKTLVYVLVKKPDDVADITIPTAAPTAPSKPEVYFIRYKTKSEVTGGGAGAAGSHLSGAGAGISGGSLSLSSSSSSNSQFNSASSLTLSTGDSSSSVSVARPQTNYGPPGQSGPY